LRRWSGRGWARAAVASYRCASLPAHGHHDAARHRRFRAGLRRASSRRRSRRRRSDLQLRFYTRTRDHLGALALARWARAHHARKRLRWALSLDDVGRDYPFWLRSPVSSARPRVEGALLAAADQPCSRTRATSSLRLFGQVRALP
jgi:hypothetical protein